MDIELSVKLQKLLHENKIADCIELCEDELIQQPKNDFRKIIGRRDLLNQAKKLNKELGKFYKSANKKIYVKSICAELNKITINPDKWEIEMYAYDNYGGTENYEWLEEWQHENKDRDNFELKGLEDIQKIFKEFNSGNISNNDINNMSAKLCEILIVLRMFELFNAAYHIGLEKEKKWIRVPLIVKANGNELTLLLK